MTQNTTEISPIVNDADISIDRMFEIASKISEPSVWLANFGSVNTRQTYGRSVADFIAKMGLQTHEELYAVTQSHIIAYRDLLKASGMSNTSITNKLSALSSLYKHLAEKQLCPKNPVSGVRGVCSG